MTIILMKEKARREKKIFLRKRSIRLMRVEEK